jgi:hypothetical protein
MQVMPSFIFVVDVSHFVALRIFQNNLLQVYVNAMLAQYVFFVPCYQG